MADGELTFEAVCDGLLALKTAYENGSTDFDISYREGAYGEGQHVLFVSVRNLLSDAYVWLFREHVQKLAYEKAAEPVEPLWETVSHPFHVGIMYKCGKCLHPLDKCTDEYCSHCGKKVKWN